MYTLASHHSSPMFTVEYPVDWKTSYCLLGMASLLRLAIGMTCRREKTHARSECRAAVYVWYLLSPHLSADEVSDEAVQVPPYLDRTISVLVGEVIWLRLVANTKRVWEVDSCRTKLGYNIRHIVLGSVVCAKCAVVWEGCVWSYVSSCWENVSDAHHPQVTGGGWGGGGEGWGKNRRVNRECDKKGQYCNILTCRIVSYSM